MQLYEALPSVDRCAATRYPSSPRLGKCGCAPGKAHCIQPGVATAVRRYRYSNLALSLLSGRTTGPRIYSVELNRYALPIVILNYGSFLVIFILIGVLEWRLDLRVSLRTKYILIGIAFCAQLSSLAWLQLLREAIHSNAHTDKPSAATSLESLVSPNREICSMKEDPWNKSELHTQYVHIGRLLCSSWEVAFSTSVISLVGMAIYLTIPAFPYARDTIKWILLPKRLRKRPNTDALSEELLLPAYSPHRAESFEDGVLDVTSDPENASEFDSFVQTLAFLTVYEHQGSSKRIRKDEYVMLPSEDVGVTQAESLVQMSVNHERECDN
ncbi:hypothetical protein AG1IA_02922 [Rhizoctonia solani AG-1 IA]|uniref:Uncharacterized protein n=1 Tax=Thanatephorus cucumeris (strain AG1-IA) TaxID=983506 RepID=L8X338_THACA|nr:hypothetical protein AG1IA_02922 [Rhizoctonia solani AG-1 IA]